MLPFMPRQTLFGTLVMLDAYARSNVEDYEGSDVEQLVSALIQKVQTRSRGKVRRIIPLPGQTDFLNPDVS